MARVASGCVFVASSSPRASDGRQKRASDVEKCPCCDAPLARGRRRAHLALCAPDALNPTHWSAVESTRVRESVLRRHGARSRAMETLSVRFGWDGRAGVASAAAVARAVSFRADGTTCARTIRREVDATPWGLDVPPSARLDEREVVFEDEFMTVVCKRAGQASTPRWRVGDDSAASACVERWRRRLADGTTTTTTTTALLGASLAPHVAHRLDLETSGCLVVCRTAEKAREVQGAFERRLVEKTYAALCATTSTSRFRAGDEGTIDHPLVKRNGASDEDDENGTGTTIPSFRVEAIVDSRDVVGAASASTEFRVVAVSPDDAYALVRCRPKTGRTHQIRAHLAAIGLPIAGDKIYGSDADAIQRHALHARALRFPGATSAVVAPFPDDFVDACVRVGLKDPGQYVDLYL